jgi:hypothetical protein
MRICIGFELLADLDRRLDQWSKNATPIRHAQPLGIDLFGTVAQLEQRVAQVVI